MIYRIGALDLQIVKFPSPVLRQNIQNRIVRMDLR